MKSSPRELLSSLNPAWLLDASPGPVNLPQTCSRRKSIADSMSLRLLRRGSHRDSGLPSIKQRSWAGEFARARSLRPLSSGTLVTNERRPRKMARKQSRGLFCSVITASSICRRRKALTSPHPSYRRRTSTTLLRRANKS